jgi:hypothetical protein
MEYLKTLHFKQIAVTLKCSVVCDSKCRLRTTISIHSVTGAYRP